MTFREEYLSDLELEQLIRDVEQNELVGAPPDLAEQILHRVRMPNKKREFRRYCIRVMTSVAAAIAVVFLLPEVSDTQLFKTAMFTYEETSDDDTMLQIINGDSIFCDNGEFYIFKGGNK